MSETLPLKYRPKYLDEMVGNKAAISMVEKYLERELNKIPSAWLLTGSSGTGKTTLARILKEELECDDLGFMEYNASNTRGIDTIRQIQDSCRISPMKGNTKVYLIDECFHGDTPITTDTGNVPIKNIKIGNRVENIYGWDTVKRTKINKVSLDRLCKVTFIDGKSTFTTTDHEYFTSKGWVHAKSLDSHICLSYVSDRVRNTQLLMEGNYESLPGQMSKLWRNIYQWINQREVLQRVFDNNMLFLWEKEIEKRNKHRENFLFNELSGKRQEYSSRNTSSSLQQGNSGKDYIKTTRYSDEYRKGCRDTQKIQRENEKKQPFFRSFNQSKDDRVQKNEWYFGWLERQTWRKWEGAFSAPTTIIQSIREWLEYGICCKNLPAYSFGEGQMVQGEQISSSLQDRYCTSGTENSNRSRWNLSFSKSKNTGGFEERKSVKGIGVESVEVYKRGSNDKSFAGIVSDTERNQGFIEMYDLEVTNHPSYKADGVIVHNCHMLTSEAQNGALKMLEDSPPGVFFILATTNPEKLIPTLVKRCAAIKLETVSPTVIMTLLQEVVEAEGKTVPPEVLSAISKNCEGTPRDALRILDAVIDMEDPEQMLYCIQVGVPENESLFDFCKMLLDKKVKWNEIASWLKENKAEPESTRRGILGILNAFLLKDGNVNTAAVMECFENNYYDSGKAGLTLSCLAAKNI